MLETVRSIPVRKGRKIFVHNEKKRADLIQGKISMILQFSARFYGCLPTGQTISL